MRFVISAHAYSKHLCGGEIYSSKLLEREFFDGSSCTYEDEGA